MVRVRAAEWPIARLLFGWFFCLTALQHLLKPARNAFFLSTAGAVNLPWAYIASAGASAVAMLAYGRWVAPQSRRRQVLGAQLVVLASLVGFQVLLQTPTTWIAGAFYVWIQIFSLLLVSQFFLVGNDLYDPRQARRLFAFIGAGGLAGGIVGAAAAGFLANEIGTGNLLWIGVGLLATCAALSGRVLQVAEVRPTDRRDEGSRDSGAGLISGGLSFVRRVPHLRMIALALFLGFVVSTLVDWMYNAAVEVAHPGNAERQAEFIGQSFAVFNAIALALQLALTSWLLRVLGMAGAMLLLPIAVAMGTTGVLLIPTIWTAAVAKGADTSLRYSVDQAAREIIWLPIPTVLKQRVKPFIDLVVPRTADGVAGVLLLLGIGAAYSTRELGILTLGIAGLWAAAVWGVRRTYRQAIERLLTVRDVDLPAAVGVGLDSRHLRDLMGDLTADTEAERVRFTLDLLAHVPSGLLESRATDLLAHPDPGVRLRAIEILEPGGGAAAIDAVRPLLEDPDPRVRGRALVFLSRTRPGEHDRLAEEWLESDEPELIEGALVVGIEHADERAVERASRHLGRLVQRRGDDAAPLRAACARALGRIQRRDPVQRHLEALLADVHPGVVEDALRAAESTGRLDLLSAVLPHLENGRRRPQARRALAALGEDGLPYLSASLRDPDLSVEVRRWIPGVFVSIETPAAYRALIEGLPALRNGRHRLYALKALNKLRRRQSRWSVPAEPVRRELDRELAEAYDLQRQIDVAEAVRRDEAVHQRLIRLYEEALRNAATATIERAFRLQGLLYPPQTIYFAYAGLTEGDTTHSAHALELLETSLDRSDAARIVPLIDPDVTPRRRAEIGGAWYDLPERDLVEDLERVLENGEEWLQAYAVALAGALHPDRLGPEIERLAATGPPTVRAVARDTSRDEREDGMPLTVVEKATALRRAELFGEMGADDLLQLAAVAEEREFSADETLFYEGEEGDYLHVILEGRLRVELGDQEVFEAGTGDTVGTFSILDRRPRSAGAVAVGPTRTLAIHRADMAQILADNYSLVERIFDYLTGIVRDMNERVYSRGGRGPDEDAKETQRNRSHPA